MDSIDNLKLAIYESGLSDEDIEAMLEYVEEAVSWDTGEGPVNLNAGDALQLGIGAATTAAAIGYGAHAGSHGVKAYKINKKKIEQEEKLKDLCEKLKMAKDKSTQKDLESRIDKLQNDIRELDKQIKEEVAKTKSSAKKSLVGAGARYANAKILGNRINNRAMKSYVDSL